MVYPQFVVLEMGRGDAVDETKMPPPGGWSERRDAKLKEVEAEKVRQSKLKHIPLEGWIFGWRRPTPKPFEYMGCCVVLEPEFVNVLVENSEEVTYAEMLKHCDLVIFAQVFDYVRSQREGHGGTLKDDRAVSFHRAEIPSTGEVYYYVDHSRIEWVYKKRAA